MILGNNNNTSGENNSNTPTLISKSEEKLDTSSMRSLTTTISGGDLDTLSEGSITSNEALEWEGGTDERPTRENNRQTSSPSATRRRPIPPLAEAGNRLSQLDLDSGGEVGGASERRASMPASIVEVVIDL